AQTASDQPLAADVRQRIVDSVAAAIERMYPAPDTGRMIADHVRQRAAAGAYRAATDPRLFARLLTQDLQAINEDTHLFVDVAPPPQGAPAPPPVHGVERV